MAGSERSPSISRATVRLAPDVDKFLESFLARDAFLRLYIRLVLIDLNCCHLLLGFQQIFHQPTARRRQKLLDEP
jgi:hypothetical protein